MAKEKELNLDPLDVQAKKKKTKLIVISIVVLFSIVAISIGSSLLSVDETKVFEKRKKIKVMDELKVIKNPEIKENWAIAIENRVDKQEALLKESADKQKHEKDIILSQLKDIIETKNAELNEKIEMVKEEQKRKSEKEIERLRKEIKSQSDKVSQLELMRRGSGGGFGGAGSKRKDIILGQEMLPVRHAQVIEKSSGNDNQDNIKESEPNFNANDELKNILAPDDEDETIKKIDKMIENEKEKEKEIAIDVPNNNIGDTLNSSTNNNSLGSINQNETRAKEEPKRKRITMINIDTSFNQKVIQEAKKIYVENRKKVKDFPSYHISTGFTQAYMVTGAYAPAFQEGSSKPLPVMFKAEGDILMANDTYGDIEDCFIIGTAKGNMNSQTADIRLVSINCLIAGGEYRIEGAISGWVIGENGIPGVPGELIHKNGALLARSFVAGFLESAATILNSGAGSAVNNVGTGGGVPLNGQTFQTAASSSAGEVFSKIADYYTKMAEQIFPVIEVKGGRTVNIFLAGGEDLAVTENHVPTMAHMTQTAEDIIMNRNSKTGEQTALENNPFVRAVAGDSVAEDSASSPIMGIGEEGSIPDENLNEGGIQ